MGSGNRVSLRRGRRAARAGLSMQMIKVLRKLQGDGAAAAIIAYPKIATGHLFLPQRHTAARAGQISHRNHLIKLCLRLPVS